MEVAAHRYSQTSLEERILQNHYSDLQQGIVHPLSIASQLVQRKVVDMALVSKLTMPAMSCLQQNAAILSAVNSSVHNDPSHFQVLLSILENTAESATLARKMRRELSTPETSVDSQQTTGHDQCYFIADCYKKDYVRLKAEYGSMFKYVQEKVKDSVSVDELKQYLCQYDELESLLQDADTMVEVMNAVRRQSTLTDYAYIAEIAHHFGIDEAKSKIGCYKKTLDDFCQHTVKSHTYVQSFCEDRSKPVPSSNKVTFKLEWDAAKTTMNDIRGILRMAFEHLADRVEILVVREGCVLLECAAPQYLMKDLVGIASKRKTKLVAMDVVKLTIGSTEVINEQYTSEYWESDRHDLSCEQSKLEKYADDKAADKNANKTRTLVSTQPLFALLVIMLMLNIFLVPLSFICIEQAAANHRPDATLFSNIANASLFSNLTTTGTNPVLKHHQLIIARNQSYNHFFNSSLISDMLDISDTSYLLYCGIYNRSHQMSVNTSKACGQIEWSTTARLINLSDLEWSYMFNYRLNWARRSLSNQLHQISVNTSKACGQLKWLVNVKLNPPSTLRLNFTIYLEGLSIEGLKLNPTSTLRHNMYFERMSNATLIVKLNTHSIKGLNTSIYLERLSIDRPKSSRIVRLDISIDEELSINRLNDSCRVHIGIFNFPLNQSSFTCQLLANCTVVDLPIKVTATDPNSFISKLTLKHFHFSSISQPNTFDPSIVCNCHLIHMEYKPRVYKTLVKKLDVSLSLTILACISGLLGLLLFLSLFSRLREMMLVQFHF